MNRLTTRGPAIGAFGSAACAAIAAVAAAGLLSGCGAGQISQMATMQPAVNGSSSGGNGVALRNVHLRAPQNGGFLKPGSNAELLFTVANDSPVTPDRLLGISSPIGPVRLTGDPTVPANGVLVVGAPDGQSALGNVKAIGGRVADAFVTLSEPISNGLTYQFTFTFQNAGPTTVVVPISAGEAPRRSAAPEAATQPGEHP